jgi:hypothetical protein
MLRSDRHPDRAERVRDWLAVQRCRAGGACLRRNEGHLEHVHLLPIASHRVGELPLEAEGAAGRDLVAELACARLAVRLGRAGADKPAGRAK